MKKTIAIIVLAASVQASSASADDEYPAEKDNLGAATPEPTTPEVTAPANPTAPPPPPLAKTPPAYSLPFQLRPITAANVVRSDTTVAGYDTADGDGLTIASTLLVSYKVRPDLAPIFRIAVSQDAPPAGDAAVSMSNPLLGALWSKPLRPDLKLALFGAVTVPIGSGGGESPNMERLAVQKAAIAARSSMDNALFAVNDLAVIGGAGLAYVDKGFTAQLETTVFQLSRVRGAESQPDAFRTNLTCGLHVGYMALPWLSVGGELRMQRWLSTPKAVADDTTGTLRENVSAAVGVRFHKKLPSKRWLRPGVSYTRGVDNPMRDKGYDIVQIDIPFVF